LLRLDVVKSVAAWVKERAKGQNKYERSGNLINKRNILPELKGLVDSLSISLDAQTKKPTTESGGSSFSNAFAGVIDFIRVACNYIPDVQLVIDIEGVDVDKCRR